MFARENFVTCGRIIKTHGIFGQIKVTFSEHFEPEYKKGDWLFLEITEKPVPFFIEGIEYQGDDLPAIQLRDVQTPEEALQIVNRPVLLPIQNLSNWQETPLTLLTLENYHVWDNNHHYKGYIKAVEEQGDQFLFTVKDPNDEDFLLPCHPSLITEISHAKKQIIMTFPEGLEEL